MEQPRRPKRDSYVAMKADERGKQKARQRWKLRLKPNCGPVKAYRRKPGAQSRQFRADKDGSSERRRTTRPWDSAGAKKKAEHFLFFRLLWRAKGGIVTI